MKKMSRIYQLNTFFGVATFRYPDLGILLEIEKCEPLCYQKSWAWCFCFVQNIHFKWCFWFFLTQELALFFLYCDLPKPKTTFKKEIFENLKTQPSAHIIHFGRHVFVLSKLSFLECFFVLLLGNLLAIGWIFVRLILIPSSALLLTNKMTS